MIKDRAVAKRYAKALFESAQDQGLAEQVEEQLRLFVETVKTNHDFRQFLLVPTIDIKDKMATVQNIFQDKISSLVTQTVQLLLENGRGSLLPALLDDFVKISNEALGQADATVTTAIQLSQEEAERIQQHFSKLTNRKIRLQQIVDPSIIGGIQVRIGDRLYDGSISTRLADLHKSLTVS